MSIIKHVTLQKIVAHDFQYDPRTILIYCLPTVMVYLPIKGQMSQFNESAVIAMKVEAQYKFCMANLTFIFKNIIEMHILRHILPYEILRSKSKFRYFAPASHIRISTMLLLLTVGN